MNFDNIWLLRLSTSFQFLTFSIALLTFWGIIKIVLLSKKIDSLKHKYFNHLVNNVVLVTREYLRLMEDDNFLDRFKDTIPMLIQVFGRKVVQNDFEELEAAIIKKRKTMNKFIWSLAMLGTAILVALTGLMLKDFIFYGNGFYIFLFIDIIVSTLLLFLIKFIL
jgi:hypothetical protein